MRARTLVVLLALVPVACTAVRAYPGPARPPRAVAVIVPDTPRHRVWDDPFSDAATSGGQVYARIDGQGVAWFADRFEVLPGEVVLRVIFRDHRTPVLARTLETRPIDFPLRVEAGKEYRIRGTAFYPPAASPAERPDDPSAYRVVITAQDAGTGEIIRQVEVPTRHIVLR